MTRCSHHSCRLRDSFSFTFAPGRCPPSALSFRRISESEHDLRSMAQQLPTKFPCWCRAVYSWGGESSKDLGFIEGDLIECLNAGDGSWWMGRLRRDKRMMGLFPSNFVVILQDSFIPISRSVSPMPEMQKTDSVNKYQEKKDRAKSRKPFQGYKSAQGPNASAQSFAAKARSRSPKSRLTIPSTHHLPSCGSKDLSQEDHQERLRPCLITKSAPPLHLRLPLIEVVLVGTSHALLLLSLPCSMSPMDTIAGRLHLRLLQ